MTEAALADLLVNARLFLILGAAMLGVGGITMIGYAARMRREAIARRVDLIVPHDPAATRDMHKGVALSLNRMPEPQTRGGLPVRDRREIIRRLAAFHVPAARALAVFTGLRLAAVAASSTVGYLLASAIPALAGQTSLVLLVAVGAAIGGWFLPLLVVGRLIKAHMRAVATGLPDALELLVVCVEAGLALDDGLERIVVEMRHAHPELAEELALTAADLKILPSRDQALANLARRVDVPSVRSVVLTLSQTMRYGTPLAQALRTVAAEMRNDSLLALEERANRLPTLLTMPMMLFIMPTIFLVVGGPAALRLIDVFLR
jgi:tight adherence protein C